ncbi:hypothetical protein K432DRAFT_185131 [Lepidopterella palustris CBS 459.81]|uniref:Uncharacterized protein n=1 Tax=Lepidopterella palustris CBS 459.81 TaxID=1314670 RepID=A0A8E2E076_9PEZI|nr:hypothetical protein K432DRAFT_185131 [Lepidopterella palustris CBS 459.81]
MNPIIETGRLKFRSPQRHWKGIQQEALGALRQILWILCQTLLRIYRLQRPTTKGLPEYNYLRTLIGPDLIARLVNYLWILIGLGLISHQMASRVHYLRRMTSGIHYLRTSQIFRYESHQL